MNWTRFLNRTFSSVSHDMRTTIFLRVLILTLTLLSPFALVSASLASPIGNPFIGRWTGIDEDNSNVYVMISADPQRFGAQVIFRDDSFVDACEGFRGILRAVGIDVEENVLKLVGVTIDCPSGGVDTIEIPDFLGFEYIPEFDEIQFCFIPDEVPLSCFFTLSRSGTPN